MATPSQGSSAGPKPVDDPRAQPRSPAFHYALLGAAALSGAFIVAFSLINDVDVIAHTTFLAWLACLLPLAWIARSGVLGAVSTYCFIAWSVLFAFRSLDVMSIIDRLALLPVLALLAGLTAFAFGGLHYVVTPLARVARGMRIAGIQAAIVSLFALTLEPVAEGTSWFNDLRDTAATTQLTFTLIALGVAAAVLTFIGIVLAPRVRSLTVVEGPISLALVAAALLYVLVPLPASTFVLLFSAVAAAMCLALVGVGLKRDDPRVFRLGGAGLLLVGLLRFVDFALGNLSLVVVVAGALGIVVVGLAAIEGIRANLDKARKAAR